MDGRREAFPNGGDKGAPLVTDSPSLKTCVTAPARVCPAEADARGATNFVKGFKFAPEAPDPAAADFGDSPPVSCRS